MAATPENQPRNVGRQATTANSDTIDLTAPAGEKDSLGQESVRDGRPATGDDTVEAMDEAGPGIPTSPAR